MQEEQNISAVEKVKSRVPHQNWVVVNIIGPGLRQKTKKSSFRILGCFETEQEATNYAERYKKLDDRFDIYVCCMYEFLPIPEEVHDVGDVQYSNKEINNLLEIHQSAHTQTQEWNSRIEQAKKTGQDKWGDLVGL
jgi:hypothetical protein